MPGSPLEFKDYYELLEVSPSASTTDIKKAFRRLALQYHPDKTNNDPYSVQRFREIREAYETLTSPSRKELYLQQRWYHQHSPARKHAVPFSPEKLLMRVIELERYVSTLDAYRVNKPGLFGYIIGLFTDEAIDQLNHYDQLPLNDEIIRRIVASCRNLPFRLVLGVQDRLNRINRTAFVTKLLEQDLVFHYRRYRWDKYRIWILLTIVLILCLLLYFFIK